MMTKISKVLQPLCLLVTLVIACLALHDARVAPVSGPMGALGPSTWGVANWYIDPANSSGCASDTVNTGQSATCASGGVGPFLTYGQVSSRYGTISPAIPYGQSVTFHFLSAQAAGQDPIFFTPRLSGGGQALLIGTLTLRSSATAGTVTPKNQTTAQLLTIASMPAGTTAKMWVVNTTRGNSAAFIDSMSGTTATMQQPLAAATLALPTGTPVLTEVNTWATGDSIQIYNIPISINLKMWRPTSGDLSSSGQYAIGWVSNVLLADTFGTGNSQYPFVADGPNALVGSVVNPRTHIAVLSGRGQSAYSLGNFHVGPVISESGANGQIFGGGLAGGLTVFGNKFIVDGDTLVHGAVVVQSGLFEIGSAYFDTSITATLGHLWNVSSGNGAFLYGAASMVLNSSSTFFNGSGGSFASSLLLTGGLQFGSGTTGCALDDTGDPAVWHCGRALTAASIDAPVSSAGFNGCAHGPHGAAFCGP